MPLFKLTPCSTPAPAGRGLFGAFWVIILALFASHQAAASYKADQVLVVKSERMLYLQRNGEFLRSYPVALGPVPRGHKKQQGDERTPEGHYVLDFKNAGSRFYKSIRISYPSRQDRLRASELGVDPGGDIMIHGQPATEQSLVGVQLFNWTDGCIAVTNEQMDEIWELVPLGTPIEIRP